MSTISTTNAENALTMTRTYPVAQVRLFNAWATEEALNAWFRPNNELRTVTQVDFRVGGSYRVEMHPEKGEPFVVSGVYETIEPHSKLVFNWQWAGESFPPSRVSLQFNPINPHATELVLTHTQLANNEERDNHAYGWEGTFSNLANAVGTTE